MSTSTRMVTGVDFVMISTSDIDRARHFYGEVLGLEASKQWGEMPAFEFETGSLTLAVADISAFGQEHSVNRQPIALQVGDTTPPAKRSRHRACRSAATPSTPASVTWRSSTTPTATRSCFTTATHPRTSDVEAAVY